MPCLNPLRKIHVCRIEPVNGASRKYPENFGIISTLFHHVPLGLISLLKMDGSGAEHGKTLIGTASSLEGRPRQVTRPVT